jgi:hypothetical protein
MLPPRSGELALGLLSDLYALPDACETLATGLMIPIHFSSSHTGFHFSEEPHRATLRSRAAPGHTPGQVPRRVRVGVTASKPRGACAAGRRGCGGGRTRSRDLSKTRAQLRLPRGQTPTDPPSAKARIRPVCAQGAWGVCGVGRAPNGGDLAPVGRIHRRLDLPMPPMFLTLTDTTLKSSINRTKTSAVSILVGGAGKDVTWGC